MDYPTHGQQRKDTSDGQGFAMSTLWPLWGPTVCNGTDLMSSPGFETLVGLLLVWTLISSHASLNWSFSIRKVTMIGVLSVMVKTQVHVCDLNWMSPKIHGETLTPPWDGVGSGALGRYPYRKRTSAFSLSTWWGHSTEVAIFKPGRALSQNPTRPTSCSWTPSLQSHGKQTLEAPRAVVFLWQPKLTGSIQRT